MNVGLVFGIIFAVIVIGFLMFFAFKYISDLSSISCESERLNQIENLKSSVKSALSLSRDGSLKHKVLVPGCMEKICFVDPEHPEFDNPEGDWEPDQFTIDFVSRFNYNVITIKSNGEIDGDEIEKFKPYVNFCIDRAKEVTLMSTGKIVEITLPEFG